MRAGKDAFVEKPLSVRLEDAVRAHDIVQATDRIVQVGTQRRSSAYFKAAEQYVRSGALGQITRVETAWNRNIASWNRSAEVVRPEDVDWEQYQMDLPRRPFDPVRYRCWQWYYEYTTGLVGLLGSHMIDVAQWFLDDPYPASAVAIGGNLAWKDGREISDTAEYVFEYPKAWLLTFSSRLGSGPEEDFEVFYGKDRKLDSRNWISRTAAHRLPADAEDVTLTDATRRRTQPRRQLAGLHAVASGAQRADPGGPGARGGLLPGSRGRAHRPSRPVRRGGSPNRRDLGSQSRWRASLCQGYGASAGAFAKAEDAKARRDRSLAAYNNVVRMRKIDLTNFTLATSETARQINRRIALNFIRLHQPMSRADLARQSGLQRSTVSAIVDQLIDEGWVTEGAVGRSPRGRRPRNLHLNVERAGILGVELRPETTTIGLAGVDARFMGQATFSTAATPEQFVEDLAAATLQLRHAHPHVHLPFSPGNARIERFAAAAQRRPSV